MDAPLNTTHRMCYFRWLFTSFVISNIETRPLPPKTRRSLSSALIIRRSLGSWRLFFLMYAQIFFVTSVRGWGVPPTTAARSASGCMAFMNAGFGARFAPVFLAAFRVAFFGAAFFAVDFFAVDFLAAFFAGDFFAVDFFMVFFAPFLAGDFFAADFFAVDLRPAFLAAFFGAALFAAGFLAAAFLPDFFVRAIDGLRQRVSLVRQNNTSPVRTKMNRSPCIRNKKICADAMRVLTVIVAAHHSTPRTEGKTGAAKRCTDHLASR